MAAKNIGGRPLQVCDLCGGVDDHPRHHLAGGQADVYDVPSGSLVAKVAQAAPEADRDRLVAELLDTGTSSRHMDCCRAAGCPDGKCDRVTAGLEDKRGKQLLDGLELLAQDPTTVTED
jgi:hypothetical protein